MFSGEYAEDNPNPCSSKNDTDLPMDQPDLSFDDYALEVDDSDIEQEAKVDLRGDPFFGAKMKTVKITDFSQVPVLTDYRRF